MGTFYTVRLWTKNDVPEDQIQAEIESLLDEFENQMSNWREGSWINRFNELPAGEPIAVPEHAFGVIELCLELADRSDGMLDPTIGPLVELWGFGVEREKTVPEREAINDAMEIVGYQKIALDEGKRTIQKTVDGVQLNCSAVAKGHAVDLVASLLEKGGIENFLVNIGGEVFARGVKEDGSAWKVGIEGARSVDGSSVAPEVVELTNEALATSGHTHRFFEQDGVRYSHILNPKTGRPVPINREAATVVAPSCALADGLATLALVTDPESMEGILEFHQAAELPRTLEPNLAEN